MKSKKILCLIDSLGMGGAERQMIGLAQVLKDKNYNVDLATYYNVNSYAELINQYHLNPIIIHTKNSKFLKLIAIGYFIYQKNYDVVIAYKNGPTVIGCLLRMLGLKFRLLVSERNTSQSINFKERIKFWLYRKADWIVPNSHAQERFILKQFPSLASKTHVITNYTDIYQFYPNTNSIPLPPKKHIQVLTVARISPQKNILCYLQAAQKICRIIPNIRFLWVGNAHKGQDAYEKECKKEVEQLGLKDFFKFIPETLNIAEYYRKADIFCLPSLYEGYPNVICEAMSSGLPIAASDICDNSIIVEDTRNALLFNPTNVDSIVSTLITLCSKTSSELYKMGMSSRKIAENKFSQEAFATKYIELIDFGN